MKWIDSKIIDINWCNLYQYLVLKDHVIKTKAQRIKHSRVGIHIIDDCVPGERWTYRCRLKKEKTVDKSALRGYKSSSGKSAETSAEAVFCIDQGASLKKVRATITVKLS